MVTPRFIIYLAFLLGISLYGLFHLKRINNVYRLVVLLLVISFCSELLTRILSATIKNSNPVYHFYAPVQFFLIMLIYSKLLDKKWIMLISFPIIVFNMVNSIFLQKLTIFPSYPIMVNYLFIIFCSLYSFYYFLHRPVLRNLFQQEWFWLSAGNLFFFSSTFLFFALLNFLLVNKTVPEFLYSSLWVIGMLFYSIYLITLLTHVQQNKVIHK
jgi:hypothetical protein